MENRNWIIIGAILFIILIVYYGSPAEVTFTASPPFVEFCLEGTTASGNYNSKRDFTAQPNTYI